MRRRPAVCTDHKKAFGPDALFPRLSHEDVRTLSLERKIDVQQWRQGEAHPPPLARKFQLARQFRKSIDNAATKAIIADKAHLRRKIARSSQLVLDFEFFTQALGWYPEMLLQRLYWDCNMMRADAQTYISAKKKSTWPINLKTLREILKHIRVVTEQIERLNETDFSPSRTAILRDEEGNRFKPSNERYLLTAFLNLPEILRFYGGDLSRKISNTHRSWLGTEKRLKLVAEEVRSNSLFEIIRAKTGRYHSVRLHRLVIASQKVKGINPIRQRAFTIWLNRLKKTRLKLTAALKDAKNQVLKDAEAQAVQ